MALAKRNTEHHLSQYKTNEIVTATPAQLVVLLYDGAIKFVQMATDNMNHKTYDVVNTSIGKAQDIINELVSSLDMESGGEISQNLLAIYIFLKEQLVEANLEKSPAKLKIVKDKLLDLKSAWDEVGKNGKLGPAVSPPRTSSSFVIEG